MCLLSLIEPKGVCIVVHEQCIVQVTQSRVLFVQPFFAHFHPLIVVQTNLQTAQMMHLLENDPGHQVSGNAPQ